MIFDAPTDLSAALDHQLAKQVMPTDMSSAELEKLSKAIRDRSFFSARTTQADYLAEAQKLIRQLTQPDVVVDPDTLEIRPARPGERMNPALVRTKMQQFLRSIDYKPESGEEGGLKDLSSDKRVDLIIDTQTKMSAGYAKWKANQDPDVLDIYPADEMYRQSPRLNPREWAARWNIARSILGDATSACEAKDDDAGPFIALKNDPIWEALSRWGDPYPPFDYNSGMWVRDADPDEAEALGVLRNSGPSAESRGLNDTLSAPAPDEEGGPVTGSLLGVLGSLGYLVAGAIHFATGGGDA